GAVPMLEVPAVLLKKLRKPRGKQRGVKRGRLLARTIEGPLLLIPATALEVERALRDRTAHPGSEWVVGLQLKGEQSCVDVRSGASEVPERVSTPRKEDVEPSRRRFRFAKPLVAGSRCPEAILDVVPRL